MVGYQEFRRPSLTTTLGPHPDTKNGILILFERFAGPAGRPTNGIRGRILTKVEGVEAQQKGEQPKPIEMRVDLLSPDEIELLNTKQGVAWFRAGDHIEGRVLVVPLTPDQMRMVNPAGDGPLLEQRMQ